MRKLFFVPFVAAMLISACSLTTPSDRFSATLNIRAYIDGRSQLIIKDNMLYWRHFDFDAPGRWEFGDAIQPTYLNRVEWNPVWPNIPDITNDSCNCDSSPYIGIPSLTRVTHRVWLDIVQGRGRVFVIQHPDVSNQFTLIVEMDDNYFDGADWYEVNLNYIVGASR